MNSTQAANQELRYAVSAVTSAVNACAPVALICRKRRELVALVNEHEDTASPAVLRYAEGILRAAYDFDSLVA